MGWSWLRPIMKPRRISPCQGRGWVVLGCGIRVVPSGRFLYGWYSYSLRWEGGQVRNLASGKRIPSPKCKKIVSLSISYNLQFCKVTLEWLNYPPSPRILHGIINELPRTLKLLPQLYEGTYSICQISLPNRDAEYSYWRNKHSSSESGTIWNICKNQICKEVPRQTGPCHRMHRIFS